MNVDDATQVARDYLRHWVDVRLCTVPPDGLYAFNPDDEYLFEVVLGSSLLRVGGTNYISASKSTGQVSDLGRIGD